MRCLDYLPATSEDMMSGSMNIFSDRMRISPGKLMRDIVWAEKSAFLPTKPNKQPTRTPDIVETSSTLSPTHTSICETGVENFTNEFMVNNGIQEVLC